MRVLGVNAIYHDPSAALVVDGEVVAPPGSPAAQALEVAGTPFRLRTR